MRVCIVAYKFYESTPRLMLFANTFARRGDAVDIIALRRPGQPSSEHANGVHIYRIQERTRNEKAPLTYLFRMLQFIVRAGFHIALLNWQKRYDLIHVFAVPDFLVCAAAIPRLLGIPILLDFYDIVPELYASKFGIEEHSIVFKLLVWVERISINLSSHAILPCEIWKDRLTSRSAPGTKCSVVHYYPDPEIFQPVRHMSARKRLRMLYPGTLNFHQGLDVAIRAFGRIAAVIPELDFVILGEGPAESWLRQLIAEQNLSDRVTIHPFVPARQIATIIAECDLGIVPDLAPEN